MSKFDKSKDINELQLKNILDILMTDEVLTSPKSIYCNFSQFSNIPFIEVTKEVSKLDKSISIILFEELNKYSHVFIFFIHIKVTSLISLSFSMNIYPNSSIKVIFPLR